MNELLLNQLAELAGKIPGTFWGVVVGSLFSLGAVILTNRHNTKRLTIQFENDRRLRIAEREHALRRDIYLAAVEALQAGFLALGNSANLDIPFLQVTADFTAKLHSIAKVQVTAEPETLKAITEVAAQISSTLLRTVGIRIPLETRKQEIAALDTQIAASSKERDRILELMKTS